MPKPPNYDSLTDINFVMNYAFAGCVPPFWLFIYYTGDAPSDLLKLFIFPDMQDIVQAVFEPKHGRKRTPARHGRKKGRGPGIPDTSEIIGGKVRGTLNPGDVMNFGVGRAAFAIGNKYEGINFAVAVAEGITDIGFNGIYGILNAGVTHCREFSRFARTRTITGVFGGPNQFKLGMAMDQNDMNVGFLVSPATAHHATSDFEVAVKYDLEYEAGATCTGEIGLWSFETGEIKARSAPYDMLPGEKVTRECSASFEAGDTAVWGLLGQTGWIKCTGGSCLGFANVDFPFPW